MVDIALLISHGTHLFHVPVVYAYHGNLIDSQNFCLYLYCNYHRIEGVAIDHREHVHCDASFIAANSAATFN